MQEQSPNKIEQTRLEIPLSEDTKRMHSKILALQEDFLKLFEKYNNSLKELDPYRGVPFTEENFPVINKILRDVQDNFQPIYPWLDFCSKQTKLFETIIADYFELINQL